MGVIIGSNPSSFESYFFYKGTVELRYDDAAHAYFLVLLDKLIEQDGVTTVVKIVDKSDMLVPWGCKMMAQDLMANISVYTAKSGVTMVPAMPLALFEATVMEAKTAHKRKLEEAADIGNDAHKWIQKYIQKQLGVIDQCPDMPIEPRAHNCCQAALRWEKRHNVRWLQTERKIYSRQYGYAGTMDGLCFADSCDDPLCCPVPFNDRLSLADWKSSNYLYLTYFMQAAAYVNAWQEEFNYQIQDRWILRLGKEDGEFDPWHLGINDQDRDFQGFLTCLELTRTMKDLKARMREIHDIRKELEQAAARAARKAELLIKCTKADKYQGIRGARPKCVEGEACQTCLKKWLDRHPDTVQ